MILLGDFEMNEKQLKIRELAKAHNAVILAHYYEVPEVQDIADHIGDSLALCLEAQKTSAQSILFCGVHFMAESAKILNPAKKVLLPRMDATCLMAEGITAESLSEWRQQFPKEAPIVTYVNSTATVKALSDICCTSANAGSVVRSCKASTVLFTPDKNLARWTQTQAPESKVIGYDGCCPIHDLLRAADVKPLLEQHPDAMLIAHPECREEVLALAHAVTSTSGMFKVVAKHPEVKTFLLATENGILHLLKKQFPDRTFIIADGRDGQRMVCPYMKMTSLDDIIDCFVNPDKHEVLVDADIAQKAIASLERMLAVPRD